MSMSYGAEQAEYYDEKTTSPRRDTIHDAVEQLHKEMAVLRDHSQKLFERLGPVMLPEPPRDDPNMRLAAVNQSSPFVGQLNDLRTQAQIIVSLLMDIDRRLTL